MSRDLESDDELEPLSSPDTEHVLLPAEIETVDAVCIKVEERTFRPYKHPSLVFTFAIAFPEQFSSVNLTMYAHLRKPASVGSKLYAAAYVANGGHHLQKRQPINKRLFLRRMFRCKVRQSVSKKDGELRPYTVIDRLIEALTGPSSPVLHP